jgi:hypothetical protein
MVSIFDGIKMLLIDICKIPIEWSLIFIATIIMASIVLTLKIGRDK